jgi:PTH1 family peptidyl-tRNA hydrolase
MRLVAGLGNPGARYESTRHNLGFRIVDEVARRLGAPAWKTKDGAAQAPVAARSAVLVKPQTFMNDSGTPLQRAAAWWKVEAPDVLVVTDDLDLPFGRLRMRALGGSGGHNGLKSVILHFGEDFPRLRAGIGRGGPDAIDHVLSTFDAAERERLPEVIDAAAGGVLLWLDSGIIEAMNAVNGWAPAVPMYEEEE